MTASATHPGAQNGGNYANNFGWTVQQNSGLDWGNVANFKAGATADPQFSYDGRYNKNLVKQALLDAKYTTGWAWPTWFQMGPKITESTYVFQNVGVWQLFFNYIGPGGGPGGSWEVISSRRSSLSCPGNGAISSPPIPAPRRRWQEPQPGRGLCSGRTPRDFVQAGTAGAYLAAFVTNPRYGSGAGQRLLLDVRHQALPAPRDSGWCSCVRYEKDGRRGEELASRSGRNQVIAAGFPVTASTGIANTIPGINYQYFSLPRSVISCTPTTTSSRMLASS